MHTRISEELDESLRRAAEELRVPVSNLVRNLLEDALDVVETVTENVGDLVGDVVEEARELGHRFESRWRARVSQTRQRARHAGERARGGGQFARDAAEIAREVALKARDVAQRAVDAMREPDERAGEQPVDETRSADRLEFPDVAGWQPLVLNTARDCAGCGRQLFRGDSAYLGTGGASPAPCLCEDCLDALD